VDFPTFGLPIRVTKPDLYELFSLLSLFSMIILLFLQYRRIP
jgi:hypothetical protein